MKILRWTWADKWSGASIKFSKIQKVSYYLLILCAVASAVMSIVSHENSIRTLAFTALAGLFCMFYMMMVINNFAKQIKELEKKVGN